LFIFIQSYHILVQLFLIIDIITRQLLYCLNEIYLARAVYTYSKEKKS